MWKLLLLSTLFLTALTGSTTKIVNQQKVVELHNKYRKKLKISPLQFSQECTNFAQQWAENLAKKNRGITHSTSNKYGENIYWSSSTSTESQMMNAWLSEKIYFNTRKRKSTFKNGHYTQIIWETTKFIGTGMATAEDGSEYWVCIYYPPGNWEGEKAYK